MYMYPDNLKGKATLWLWYLRDIGIVGVGAIIGVIAISHANFYMPMALVGCYAFFAVSHGFQHSTGGNVLPSYHFVPG